MGIECTREGDRWVFWRAGEAWGEVPPAPTGLEIMDRFDQVRPEIFHWKRTWRAKQAGPARLTMDFHALHRAEYAMVPGISYNGNRWGSGGEPKGFEVDGEPWVFASHRSSVPGCTYSEGSGRSVALLAAGRKGGFSCSLIPEAERTIHRLLWPEEEAPKTYVARDSYGPPFRDTLLLSRGHAMVASAYLVFADASKPKTAWRTMLDFAWDMNHHELRPWFPPSELWRLGVRFAKESLWAEEGPFRGFSIGLVWTEDGWHQRPTRKFEIGWAGQNGSLANSLLWDYLQNGDADSRDKAVSCLDAWAQHGRLGTGLFLHLFDFVLGDCKSPPEVDACNLGDAALEFLEACALCERCGISRPVYREVGLDICEFIVRQIAPTGRIGRSWAQDGTLAHADGTIGAFCIPPLLRAYELTEDARYLEAARRSYEYYMGGLLEHGFTTAGALDTDCIDKESALPLMDAGVWLHRITEKPCHLEYAEQAAYYLASWQWHHTVPFGEDTTLGKLGYDTFGGTSVSAQHHHQDPFALSFVPSFLELARLTGSERWRQRARAAWANGTIGVSDGDLVLRGKLRPAGSQDEGFFHTRWLEYGEVCDWLVSWPTAFRLCTLRRLRDWSELADSRRCTTQ